MTAEPGTERAPEESLTWTITTYPTPHRSGETTYAVNTPYAVLFVGDQELAEDIAAIPLRKRQLEQALDREIRQRVNVPVQRSEHQLLVSLCQLQEETLAELRHIRAALTADDRKDSFSFDNNASAGKVKVSGKRYAATIGDARADAELEFARGMAFVEEAQEVGWRATVQKIEAAQAGAAS